MHRLGFYQQYEMCECKFYELILDWGDIMLKFCKNCCSLRQQTFISGLLNIVETYLAQQNVCNGHIYVRLFEAAYALE